MNNRTGPAATGLRLAACLCIVALGLGGCASLPKVSFSQSPKPAATVKRNFVGDPKMPQQILRVLLLPVAGCDAAPDDSAAALDSVFATELVRQKRFEVVTISRDEFRRRFGSESLPSSAALPNGFLEEIARDFAAQGVVFVDLTAYHPIRPITIGVRSKLALTAGGRLVWSFDDVFSAEDPSVLAGIRKFYAAVGGDRGESPDNLPEAALISPSRYGAYCAFATFETLPTR